MARFRSGTLARMKAVLAPGEKQSDMIRIAVEAELARRENATGTQSGDNPGLCAPDVAE